MAPTPQPSDEPTNDRMRVAVLGSGSRGNALVVESRGRRLMIDAGFSCRQLELRLAGLGIEAGDLDALLLTHEHSDHVRGAERFLRRNEVPVYATAGTFTGSRLGEEAAKSAVVVRSGAPFEVGGFQVEAFNLPHDAREPVGYVLEDGGGQRFGIVSDLGARSQLAWGRLRDLDGLVIETNHDLQMLRSGPYPWYLKQRIAGRHGHLSNREAADGVADLVNDCLSQVLLYHLSQKNNLPALAAQAVGERLLTLGSDAQIVLTRQDEATPWIELGKGSCGEVEEQRRA